MVMVRKKRRNRTTRKWSQALKVPVAAVMNSLDRYLYGLGL